MTPEIQKSQVIQDQLADLNQTLEKEKVQLTPEVEQYVRSHVRTVQDKLQAGEDVRESDLEFIGKVRMWVLMPKEWRNKYKSVEEMVKSEEMKNVTISDVYEANKRHISPKQWVDLLHVAEVGGEGKEWVDETFKFPGGGKIRRVQAALNFENCTGLTRLPDGLSVDFELYLNGCTGLTELPENLIVSVDLYLDGCTGLTKIPKGLKVGESLSLKGCRGLTELPENLIVSVDLELEGCTSLTSLPNNLKLEGSLLLKDCTSLTSLPKNLELGTDLYLSKNLQNQVKEDAEKLKAEGKIKGEIFYAK